MILDRALAKAVVCGALEAAKLRSHLKDKSRRVQELQCEASSESDQKRQRLSCCLCWGQKSWKVPIFWVRASCLVLVLFSSEITILIKDTIPMFWSEVVWLRHVALPLSSGKIWPFGESPMFWSEVVWSGKIWPSSNPIFWSEVVWLCHDRERFDLLVNHLCFGVRWSDRERFDLRWIALFRGVHFCPSF